MSTDPKKEKDPLLMDHEYDGIYEYDNPMPRWWLYIFWASILYSVLYFLNVPGIGIGRGRIANYEREVAAAADLHRDHTAAAAGITEDQVRAVLADAAKLEGGKATFVTTCSPCHKNDGGGSIGPNLTDPYWIHGKDAGHMIGIVANGVLDKGMPAWSTVLKPAQIAAVVAYVMTLEGTHPPDARGPQGVHADSAAAAAGEAEHESEEALEDAD
jgi:cytochrome c oxidase cbb3-type subunit 3